MTLLTDEIRARLGETRRYTAPEELGRAAIRYFARAIGDDNPLYTDDGYARTHGYDGVVAPPTLILETGQYTDLPRDADGYSGHAWGIEVPDTRVVRGGNSYVFHQAVRPSDVVTATWTLTGLSEHVTRSGAPILVVTSEAHYTNQHGDSLATNTETIIYVGLAP